MLTDLLSVGALLAKRKDELAHIAKDLDLNLPDYTLRPDIIEGIRTKLRSDPAARHDPRFHGLWLSMRESRKSSEDTVDLNEHAIDDEDDDEEEDDQDREDDSRDEVDQGIADAEEAITSYRDVLLHNKIVDSLLHGEAPLLPDSPARHGVSSGAEAVEKALVPASHALRTVTRRSGSFSQLARRGSTSLRHAARETVTLVEDVQDRASQSWVVVACILAAETAWLVYEAVPWVENVSSVPGAQTCVRELTSGALSSTLVRMTGCIARPRRPRSRSCSRPSRSSCMRPFSVPSSPGL